MLYKCTLYIIIKFTKINPLITCETSFYICNTNLSALLSIDCININIS